MSRIAPIDSLFVCEYLCSGMWPESELPVSLYREGYLMWTSLLEDLVAFLAAKNYLTQIVTLCDRRIPSPQIPGVRILQPESVTQAEKQFDELVSSTRETILIAPEIDRIQQRYLQRIAAQQRGRLLCSLEAASLTGDKWAFHQWCQARQIPTLPTCLLTNWFDDSDIRYPVVIKPRWGAGSAEVLVIRNQQQFGQWLHDSTPRNKKEWIVQPEISGPFLSQGALIDTGGQCHLFPIGQQIFDGLTYRGGSIPFPTDLSPELTACSRGIVEQMPGLSGLLGMDYALTQNPDSPFVVMELNPRLTTAYLGYRQLCEQNLMEVWLTGFGENDLGWQRAGVSFTVSGKVEYHAVDQQKLQR